MPEVDPDFAEFSNDDFEDGDDDAPESEPTPIRGSEKNLIDAIHTLTVSVDRMQSWLEKMFPEPTPPPKPVQPDPPVEVVDKEKN